MLNGLLLYNDYDYEVNRDFAKRFTGRSKDFGLNIELVLESGIRYGLRGGKFCFEHNGKSVTGNNYVFAINRTRNAFIARVLENLGVRVFNGSGITALCNDKNAAYLQAGLLGLPLLDTYIYTKDAAVNAAIDYPAILKEPFSHGGDDVYLCENHDETKAAIDKIKGRFVTLQQKLPSKNVCDIRVFVLGNKVIGAVKRSAVNGFKANYCKGGQISLYEIDCKLQGYVDKLLKIGKFDFAGFDFLYNGDYFFNEIEDAVGSRSLCILKNIDTSVLYMEYITGTLKQKQRL
jgi:glutathione synthase/RimK-type ligase-like ATP-grasp enzyme